MLGNAHFYNRTIRKIVIAMGTVLNDIQLVRYTKDGLTAKEKFKVPLSYGAKEKYLVRITSDPTLTKSVNIVVPRISFELTGMNYDSSRKQQTTLMNCSTDTNTSSKTQYLPVPYDFTFDAAIYVRNTEDGTQILEQILPFFTPDFTVTAKLVPDLNRSYDLPIILNSVSNEVDYEGDFMTTRLIIWNLSFTVKGYIFPGVKDSKIIRGANTSIIDIANTSQIYVNINTQTDPANTSPDTPDDEFGFAEIIIEAPDAS
jgi:T4-like virus Myoviridae tail sheath stabiliser